MILRKPYAFLIKHFKLLHLILIMPIAYLMFRINMLLTFFSSYLKDVTVVNGKDLIGDLFNVYMFLIPFIIILFSIILFSVMRFKQKPRMFYFVSIIVSIVMLIILNMTYGNLEVMQNNIINVRTVSLVRDFLTIALILLSVMIIIFAVRATGFDIKKFNFGQDLQELEIDVEDNEEFEVNVEFNTNEINRGFRRRLRYARYVYVENKFLISIVSLIMFTVASFFIYFKMTVYDKVYKQTEVFSTTNFVMHVNNTYITDKDYKGNIITSNYLIVVDMSINKNFGKNRPLDTVSMSLDVGNNTFTPTLKYREKIIDLGTNYIEQLITSESNRYLIVFEVPKNIIDNEMILKYVDKIDTSRNNIKPLYVRVRLDKKYIDNDTKNIQYNIAEPIEINNAGLIGSKVVINSYEISYQFKNNYKFCISTNECFNSYEYLKPDIINNYDKTLLKIKGSSTVPQNIDETFVYNIYNFIDYFGNIKYQINGNFKSQKIRFKQVMPQKYKEKDTYYIEILKEIENADKISLEFKVRGYTYEYILK